MTGHTLIIGGGISGLSVALALLRRGHRVTVLERGQTGGESSWAGGGILSPLLPWGYGAPVTALALRSMAAYAGWIAAIEATAERNTEFWRCGMLALAVTAPKQALAWCTQHGMAAQRGSSTQAATLSPALPLRGGGCDSAVVGDSVWLPDVAQVRNPRLVSALRVTVERMGGVIREDCQAIEVLTANRQVTAVRSATATLPADRVVLATGAWAGLGVAGLAATPHIRPIRGQMLLFKLPPGVLNTIVYRNGLYLIPRRDGHVLVGSTLEDVGFDKSTDGATRLRLHAEAAELLPALADVQPVQHWAGLRPGSPNNIPIIDRHPDFENVFINAGHYRYGVTLAPASAELLVDLMEDKPTALDPAHYSWQAALERRWVQNC